MKKYRVIQIVEETYYIEAENEDDALAQVHFVGNVYLNLIINDLIILSSSGDQLT